MYYVDIPVRVATTENGGDDTWQTVAEFKEKADAVNFIRAHIGPCDKAGRISLITEGQDEE